MSLDPRSGRNTINVVGIETVVDAVKAAKHKNRASTGFEIVSQSQLRPQDLKGKGQKSSIQDVKFNKQVKKQSSSWDTDRTNIKEHSKGPLVPLNALVTV